MRCSSDVLKKTSPLDVFGDVSEKVKHLTNDAFNDVSPPALTWYDQLPCLNKVVYLLQQHGLNNVALFNQGTLFKHSTLVKQGTAVKQSTLFKQGTLVKQCYIV